MHAGVTGDRPLKNFSLPTPYCSQGGQPLAHFPTAMMAYLITRGSEPRVRTEPSETLSQGSFFPSLLLGVFSQCWHSSSHRRIQQSHTLAESGSSRESSRLLGSLRQGNHKFKPSLGYRINSNPATGT